MPFYPLPADFVGKQKLKNFEDKFMNRLFVNNFRLRLCVPRLNAFFLVVLFLTFQTASFGQTFLVTREQFSRFPLLKRARTFEPTISRIAAVEGVDPYLLWTIAYNETRFRPWLRSYAGAEGLMQFIPATAARFNLFNPYQPEPAIRAAARYVKFLSNRFGGRIDSILAGYNAGEGAVDAFLSGKTIRAGKKIINPSRTRTVGGVPPYRETIGYVARGLVVYRLLRLRQMFQGEFVQAIYPTAVSESVARVWLRDPEIGFAGTVLTQFGNPNFSNTSYTAQNFITTAQSNEGSVQTNISTEKNVRSQSTEQQANNSATSVESVSTNSTNDTSENKTVTASNEIYYEPRTGARYENRNGKMERLNESGELIVGNQFPGAQPSAIRARGTFFGGNKLAPK